MSSRKPVTCDGCKVLLSRRAYLPSHRKRCWFYRLTPIQQRALRAVEKIPEPTEPTTEAPVVVSKVHEPASVDLKVPACPRLVSFNRGSTEKRDCTQVILNGFQNYLLNFKAEWSNPT